MSELSVEEIDVRRVFPDACMNDEGWVYSTRNALTEIRLGRGWREASKHPSVIAKLPTAQEGESEAPPCEVHMPKGYYEPQCSICWEHWRRGDRTPIPAKPQDEPYNLDDQGNQYREVKPQDEPKRPEFDEWWASYKATRVFSAALTAWDMYYAAFSAWRAGQEVQKAANHE